MAQFEFGAPKPLFQRDVDRILAGLLADGARNQQPPQPPVNPPVLAAIASGLGGIVGSDGSAPNQQSGQQSVGVQMSPMWRADP